MRAITNLTVLVLVLFAVSTASKKNTSTNGKRPAIDVNKSKVRLKDSDTIDIDISQDAKLLDGSGAGKDEHEDDDEDDDDDDEDDNWESSGVNEIGSGGSRSKGEFGRGGKGPKTCLKLLSETSNKMMVGAYVPRCTASGEFAPLQCHGSTGQCWCADKDGKRIPGTMRDPPNTADCSNLGRDASVLTATSRRPSMSIGGRIPTRQQPSISVGKPSKPVAPSSPPRGGSGGVYAPPTPGPYRPNNKIDQFPFDPNNNKVYIPKDLESNEVEFEHEDRHDPKSSQLRTSIITSKPGVLAGIIGGTVIGLLCAILLVMFIVYRLCKNKEQVDEKTNKMPIIGYTNGHDRDLYA